MESGEGLLRVEIMFTINRKQLAAELSLLQSVLEVKTTMPMLACVKIEARDGLATFTASRIDATLITVLPCEGEDSYCVPLTMFRDAVRLASDGPVTFQRKENRIEMSAERSRHRFPVYRADAFPDIDELSGLSLSIDAVRLLDAVERVSPCADKREGKYATQGVCIEAAEGDLNVVAFDGTQAGIVRLMDTELEFQATVPNVALPALRAVLTDREQATVTVNADGLMLECDGRKFIARLLLGEFPPWRMIVPADCPHSVILTAEVRDAIRRCCVTASEGNLVRRRLKLEFTKELLVIQSYGGDGESIEEVPISCPTLNGDSLQVKVNADQLLGFLQQVEAPELRLKDAASILLLTEGEQRYLHATLRPDA